jgi:protein SCO1/2
MRLGAASLALLLTATQAMAGLSRAVLDKVRAEPPPGARLDLGLAAPDTTGRRRTIAQILGGRPAFVNFVDYTCNTLCGTDLLLLADGIHRAGLSPRDFRIIVIGIDPKDPPQAALAMENSEIPAALRSASTFLLPDQNTVARATSELGFRYAYDPKIDQFAHPAVIYVIDSGGVVRQLLSPLALTAGDMRRVLQNSVGSTFIQQIHSLCYGYDPSTGTYNLRVTFLLRAAALFTLILLGTGILLLSRAWRWRR